jgi:hypothetical protein
MARNDVLRTWFGEQAPIGDMPMEAVAAKLALLGDGPSADDLRAAAADRPEGVFGGSDVVSKLLSRFVRTAQVCGFLPDAGENRIVAVNEAVADPGLADRKLKVTLEALHVARYPGFGAHRLLFDFAIQAQAPDTAAKAASRRFHYNARFEAADGETVNVRNFPLFYGVTPTKEGLEFGFQTVNVSSSFDTGLLDFLKTDDFKTGLDLALAAVPGVSQLSTMAVSLTRWLAGQSANAKVQEFHQGLDFRIGRLSPGLAAGFYIVAQIPQASLSDWTWDDWTISPQLMRLVRREDTAKPLDFNHLIIGIRPAA